MQTKKRLNNYFYITISFISIIFILLNYPIISHAEDSQGSSAGFTYNTIYPDSQISNNGYLDLLLKPKEKTKFTLTLSNPSKEEVNVDINISGAKTNKNGVIEYSPNNIPNDKSLKYPFEKIVTGPTEIKLKPNEVKNIDFEITMPDEEFDGQIVGGISMIRSQKDDSNEKSEGTQIKNRYRYVVPVVLQNKQIEVKPKLELNKVYPEQMNSKNTIFVDFSNINATFFNDMSVEVNITEKGKEAILYQTKKTNMRMAPNTLIQFPVSMQGEKMIPGNYTAKIQVKGSKGIIENWTQDFKITKEQADKYNERDIGLYEEKSTNWKLISIIVIGTIILIGIIYFILSKIKENKTNKKSNKKKNKKRNK